MQYFKRNEHVPIRLTGVEGMPEGLPAQGGPGYRQAVRVTRTSFNFINR